MSLREMVKAKKWGLGFCIISLCGDVHKENWCFFSLSKRGYSHITAGILGMNSWLKYMI